MLKQGLRYDPHPDTEVRSEWKFYIVVQHTEKNTYSHTEKQK